MIRSLPDTAMLAATLPHCSKNPDAGLDPDPSRRSSGTPLKHHVIMALPDDAELAKRIRESDAEAFKMLFYRYYEPVLGFVLRRMGDAAKAEDVVQDAFARLWEARSRVNDDGTIRAYLYRLASNRMIDHFRSDEVRRDYAAQADGGVALPVAEFFAVEEDVRKAIDALPDSVRTTFVLSRYDELSYREIAKLLNVSVKTVEKRMSQALRSLRTDLAHLLTLLILIWLGTRW